MKLRLPALFRSKPPTKTAGAATPEQKALPPPKPQQLPAKAKAKPKAKAKAKSQVKINPNAALVRHPIKAATLLYSAPSFVLRGPIYIMFISLFAMLIYSIIATMDTLVVAPLKLQRQTITVSAVAGGLVETIAGAEGTVVTAGTPLATIQEKIRAVATPEQEAIDREIRNQQDRRDAAIRDYDFRLRQSQSQLEDLERNLATSAGTLSDRLGQLTVQLESSQRSRRNILQDLDSARANFARLQRLCELRDIPIVQCDQAQQRVSDLQRAATDAEAAARNIELSIATTRRELEASSSLGTIERLRKDIAKLAEDREDVLMRIDERIADLERRRNEAQTLVAGVRYDNDRAYYSGVADGIVSAVHIQRGQLISPGMPLFTIVRSAAPLEARVLVFNKDIGLLTVGQNVQLKYFAYPFQEYGIQTGSVSEISTRPSTQPGENSRYVVRVALAKETIKGRTGIEKPLEIGLEGMAEIKVGERRFIELLFAPAARFFRQQEEEKPAENGTPTS